MQKARPLRLKAAPFAFSCGTQSNHTANPEKFSILAGTEDGRGTVHIDDAHRVSHQVHLLLQAASLYAQNELLLLLSFLSRFNLYQKEPDRTYTEAGLQ